MTAPLSSITWLLLTGLTLVPVARSPAASLDSKWSMRAWMSDDGLTNNVINSLAQTPDGYLYMATPAGLTSFDGVRFQAFPCKEFSGDSSRKIRALVTNRDGALCLAMDGGIAVLKSGKRQIFTEGMASVTPRSIMEDGDGAYWITHDKSRVCRIKGGKVKHFGTDDGLDANEGCTLASDHSGRVWFAQGNKVGLFRNERFEVLLQLPAAATRIAPSSDGGIWICSNGGLLKFHEGGSLEDRGKFDVNLPVQAPKALLEDRTGAVWIGMIGRGLFRYDGVRFEPISTSHSGVIDVMQDREGNLWVGTNGGGLNRLVSSPIELQEGAPGLPFQSIRSMCQDSHGNIWAVGQLGELGCRTESGWRIVSNESTWPGGGASCIAADHDGGIWIGGGHRLLHRLPDGRFEKWEQSSNGLLGVTIRAMHYARNGDLWIAGQFPETVQRFRNGVFETFTIPNGIQLMRAMAEDSAGNIWIGAARGGLLCVKDGVLKDMTSQTTGVPTSIRCLLADPDGSIWIGYAGSGLGRLKDGQFHQVQMDHGLYDDVISQMHSDDRGWFWFGSDHGIFKVQQKELNALMDSHSGWVHSVYYDREDGAPSLQANAVCSPSSLRGSDGQLWMPMLSCLARVNPDNLPEDAQPPSVLLNRILLDDRVIAASGGVVPVQDVMDLQRPAALEIPPSHRRLEIQFAALAFRSPKNVHFRYRLEGFDDGWIEAGAKRTATYSRLNHGNYRFRVTACNSDGVWNETGATLAFTVAPYLWQTWWLRLGATAMFAVGVGGSVRYVSLRQLRLRLQALKQQAALDRERTRIARDIHDDLGASLTQMALLTGLAIRPDSSKDRVASIVQQISNTVRQVTDSLDEIVWAVNPRNDTLRHLVDYLGKFALELLRTAGVRHSIDLPDRCPARALSAEVRHHLFLVVKEALNNAVRHAQATEISVAIAVADETLQITIQDNGKGFSGIAADGEANGLQNMRERMKSVGGDFQIETRPGSGTRIALVCPCV